MIAIRCGTPVIVSCLFFSWIMPITQTGRAWKVLITHFHVHAGYSRRVVYFCAVLLPGSKSNDWWTKEALA